MIPMSLMLNSCFPFWFLLDLPKTLTRTKVSFHGETREPFKKDSKCHRKAEPETKMIKISRKFWLCDDWSSSQGGETNTNINKDINNDLRIVNWVNVGQGKREKGQYRLLDRNKQSKTRTKKNHDKKSTQENRQPSQHPSKSADNQL